MRAAIEVCRRGTEAGQAPFGAQIVRGGEVLATAHNRVWQRCDPSAHAEVEAIREACRGQGHVHLIGATVYSTTEPCPMCLGAIHWARIGRIVYGTSIADAAAAGFNELALGNRQLIELSGSSIELVPGVLRADCMALFALWRERRGREY